jgi:hypothetical protein
VASTEGREARAKWPFVLHLRCGAREAPADVRTGMPWRLLTGRLPRAVRSLFHGFRDFRAAALHPIPRLALPRGWPARRRIIGDWRTARSVHSNALIPIVSKCGRPPLRNDCLSPPPPDHDESPDDDPQCRPSMPTLNADPQCRLVQALALNPS